MIWARVTGSRPTLIPVETCAEGQGDLGLVRPLFASATDMLEVEKVGNRTKYRSHREHCPADAPARAAFSAGGGKRKERPA